MQDEPKYRNRPPDISHGKIELLDVKSWTQHISLFHLCQLVEFLPDLVSFTPPGGIFYPS